MIILTGAAGFIGSVLLKYLNSEGYRDIIVVDNLGNSEKWKNLLAKDFNEYWSKQKLLTEIQAKRLPKNIDAIIHLGACSSTLETNVEYLLENNYQYSVELARYCSEKNIRFIYASSAATYGDGKLGFSDVVDIKQFRPLNPYGFSKQLFDLWAESNGILTNSVGIKFFNVFGPNEYHKGPMQSMVLKGYKQIISDGKIKLYKSSEAKYQDGGQLRDFIYVKDCCKVILWLLKNQKVSGLFNLGAGKARSWNDLANAIFAAAKIAPNIEYISMPQELARQYQNFTQAEMKKLTAAGYSEEFSSLEDCVNDYISNYLSKDYINF